MNEAQRQSVARYLYDLSKAVHIGWLLGLATEKISWLSALLLAIIGMNLFAIAYKKEAGDE